MARKRIAIADTRELANRITVIADNLSDLFFWLLDECERLDGVRARLDRVTTPKGVLLLDKFRGRSRKPRRHPA
jgi:hypothetical protein